MLTRDMVPFSTINQYKEIKRQMFGIDDPQIWMAYLLCIGGALGCIIYGLRHWNEKDPEEEN